MNSRFKKILKIGFGKGLNNNKLHNIFSNFGGENIVNGIRLFALPNP